MKKSYLQPVTTIVEIHPAQMMATSAVGLSMNDDFATDGEVYVKENTFDVEWDNFDWEE